MSFMPSGLFFFSNNQKINLDDINTKSLSKRKTVISSDDLEFANYNNANILATSHIIAIPINPTETSNDNIWQINGVLLLFSQTAKIDITHEQLSILHTILNGREPTTLSSNLYLKAVGELDRNEHISSFSPHHLQVIYNSLDAISNKEDASSMKPGLRHFSLWNVSDEFDELNKEFNRNTFSNESHSITNNRITGKTKHYLAEILKKHGKNYRDGSHILGIYSFSEVVESVKDLEYFDKVGITKESGSLVVVSFKYKDEKKIACLYIHRFPYSIFISPVLICSYIRIICEFIFAENTFKQNEIFQQLIRDSFESNKEESFYAKATDYLIKMNEAEDCLIYMYNEKDILSLRNKKFDNNKPPQTTISSNILPKPYSEDGQFCNWVDDWQLQNRKDYCENDGKIVKTALIIPVAIFDNKVMGYILLINKNCTQSIEGTFYNNIFHHDNYKLSKICGMVLSQYQQMCNYIESRKYLLKKLRHEIPSNTDAIKNAVADITTGLREKPLRENYLLTIAHNIELNNSRVMMLAKFFTTIDFPKELFAEDKGYVNIYHFLNSYIDMFRTEGQYRGVDVYFTVDNPEHYIYVSNYYQLAIINVITNAIRYAAEGTSVVIEVTKDKIIVSDIGIQMSVYDMKHIYDEGFRSRNARKVNEKGMGYGLYLSKMILESHQSAITAQCNYCAEENVFAQKAVYDYIMSLPSKKEREDFIYKDLTIDKHPQALKSLFEITTVTINPKYHKYINAKITSLNDWMKYYKEHHCVFIDFGQTIFPEPVYEVIFTITI